MSKSPLLIYIGTKIGNLTIIGLEKTKYGNYFQCKCDCGNIVIKSPQHVRNGTVTTCGHNCPIHIINKQQKQFDLYSKYINRRFSSNVVIGLEYLPLRKTKTETTKAIYFNLLCDCGNRTTKYAVHVINGKIKYCDDIHCKFRKKQKCKIHHKKYFNFTIINVIDHNCKLKCECGNIIDYRYEYIQKKHRPRCTNINCKYSIPVKSQYAIQHHESYVGLQQNNLIILEFIYDPTLSHPYNYQFRCKCLSCNRNDFLIPTQQFNNFTPFHCSKCQSKSNVELSFSSFLIKLNMLDYRYNVWIPSKSNIQSKIEIDFLIDDSNVGIELHGLTTHATTKGDYDNHFIGNKHRTYHLNKTESCENEGIDLIQFWNTEWIQKPDICKSIILNRLNKPKYRSYARKCVIREIDKQSYDEFMEMNHLQGSTRGESVRLGLFYKENDQLVSVMSFGHSRFSRHQWEMFRFAGYIYTQIIGAASKLFKYFIRNWSPDNIVSYSDRRIFNSGGLYKTLGFRLSHVSDPNYWYFEYSRRETYKTLYHRSSFMKHKLKDKLATFDPNLSEWENMEMNGYLRIYDCGNKVYMWNK